VDGGPDTGWQARELAEVAGTTVRTIHYYTAEGLLPPPEGSRRMASYTPAHLARLRIIAALRDEGLALAAIRARLAPLSDEQVLGVVATLDAHLADKDASPLTVLGIIEAAVSREVTREMAGTAANVMTSPPASPQPMPVDVPSERREPESASDYLERVLRRKPAPQANLLPKPPPKPGIDEGGRPVAWHRFPIADGVELHLRDDQYHAARGRARAIVHEVQSMLRRYGLAPSTPRDRTRAE
jgi:DNA-binding transcriptional MerR regulator